MHEMARLSNGGTSSGRTSCLEIARPKEFELAPLGLITCKSSEIVTGPGLGSGLDSTERIGVEELRGSAEAPGGPVTEPESGRDCIALELRDDMIYPVLCCHHNSARVLSTHICELHYTR